MELHIQPYLAPHLEPCTYIHTITQTYRSMYSQSLSHYYSHCHTHIHLYRHHQWVTTMEGKRKRDSPWWERTVPVSSASAWWRGECSWGRGAWQGDSSRPYHHHLGQRPSQTDHLGQEVNFLDSDHTVFCHLVFSIYTVLVSCMEDNFKGIFEP